MRKKRFRHQRGNALFLILIGVAALGLVTGLVVSMSKQTHNVIPRATVDSEISVLLGQSAALAGALEQMIAKGANPATLWSDLSLWKLNDADDGSQNLYRIYSPLGGGIKYISATSDGSAPVANNFNINNGGSLVEGVGPTDGGAGYVPDIIFVANVTQRSYCQRINEVLTGSSAMPVVDDIEDMVNTVVVSIGDSYGNCTGCIGVARICARNVTDDIWGFYSVILPG